MPRDPCEVGVVTRVPPVDGQPTCEFVDLFHRVLQLASLRAMPNMMVLRPSDATGTVEAWRVALQHTDGPVADDQQACCHETKDLVVVIRSSSTLCATDVRGVSAGRRLRPEAARDPLHAGT